MGANPSSSYYTSSNHSRLIFIVRIIIAINSGLWIFKTFDPLVLYTHIFYYVLKHSNESMVAKTAYNHKNNNTP